jgi:hypothetical protein
MHGRPSFVLALSFVFALGLALPAQAAQGTVKFFNERSGVSVSVEVEPPKGIAIPDDTAERRAGPPVIKIQTAGTYVFEL